MLRAFALAEQRAVPEVRNSSVSGLKLGVSVMVGMSISGTGYSAYGAMAVSTTSTVRRGFESDKNVERVRRKECAGCAAATFVRMVDALAGRVPSTEDPAALAASSACFRARLRRCGGRCELSWGVSWMLAVKVPVVWLLAWRAEVHVDAEVCRNRWFEMIESRQLDRSTARFDRKKLAVARGAAKGLLPLRGARRPPDEESHREGWRLPRARMLRASRVRLRIRGGRIFRLLHVSMAISHEA